MIKFKAMKKIGIFYGSTTGTTKAVAEEIGKIMNVDAADIYDVADAAPSTVGDYDLLLLGTSTWGSGELQDDWYDFIAGLEVLDFKGKKIALFGCGDESMSDTFCNAVGELYRRLQSTGAEFIGFYPATCYSFDSSSAVSEGIGVGLLLDNVNRPELSADRIKGWVEELYKNIDL